MVCHLSAKISLRQIYLFILSAMGRAHTQFLPANKGMDTGGHRTRVAAGTLDNMAQDAVAALASLR